MRIKLAINDAEDDQLADVSLDSSSTIASWLVDYYFTKFYSNQVKSSSKSVQPDNIIGLHDMFIMYQIVQTPPSPIEFFGLCKKKFDQIRGDSLLDNYNNYLARCGLKDMIDLVHQCKLNSFVKQFSFEVMNVKSEVDHLMLNYLLDIASGRFTYDENTQISTIQTKQSILELFNNQKNNVDQAITKNYIKHTICTYLTLLLDTRNEHALIHCLATPARAGIERRTIVELRRLSKLSKNECLTIYQILLSFLRRKELLLSRSSQQDSVTGEDESFFMLDKYYVGIKDFFDFIEQMQITIEENEHLKIESIVTFRKIMSFMSKQLRKDTAFTRCDLLLKEITEEFCQCFQTTSPLMDCTSPIRSASSGGTLAGRRFLRSVAYLCAKQTIHLPIILSNNDHYDSPSTGLRKATSFRLLQSPITPIPIAIEKVVEAPVEEKTIEIPVESVFVWQKKKKPTEESDEIEEETSANDKRFRRRKSQRCLDLSTIEEKANDSDLNVNPLNESNEKVSSQSHSSGSSRQPLGEIDVNSFHSDERQPSDNEHSSSQHSMLLSLASGSDQENLPVTQAKRTTTKVDPPCKRQKKVNSKALAAGQKMITSFFQSKS